MPRSRVPQSQSQPQTKRNLPPRSPQLRQNWDSPWKEIAQRFFPYLLQFLLVELYEAIDWNYPPRFLDKELKQATRGSQTGTKQDREAMFWFLDWVMVMPAKEERRFDTELVAWEEERQMRYVIGAERRGEQLSKRIGTL